MACVYTLLLRDEPILAFEYDEQHEAVTSIERMFQPRLAPVGACEAPDTPTLTAFSAWIHERAVPGNRFDWEYKAAAIGCASPMALLFRSRALSLADQYWVRCADDDAAWADVNFFDNDYPQDIDGIGPSAATGGSLFKWWEKRDGVDTLVKVPGDSARETFAALAAAALYARLLDAGDFVPYGVEMSFGDPYATCPCFTNAHTQFVSMRDLARCHGLDMSGDVYGQYRDLLRALGIEDARTQLAKLIVCDFLGANIGRNAANMGVLRSCDDGSFLGAAPLFGCSHSFYIAVRQENDFVQDVFPYVSAPFSRYPTVQLAMAEDFSWLDPDALDGFEDEVVAILGGNDLAPEWYPRAAAEQFTLQFSHLMSLL